MVQYQYVESGQGFESGIRVSLKHLYSRILRCHVLVRT